ncbi:MULTISPECIES: DUF6708 domain-containing protein [unclassified Pseudomonas]|uniref:DUF6708 domain-containing protein n=1 Tax=unclassified Pseudomonas TaxID=196821 RepID=UPI0021C897AB|nr:MULTISPECIES: DUF6708 domain-containing protein [unclassified Pseudomonas]MCU1730977.1 hypothetical protein [Pseudomonas sp. 20P_3.2_Bac4]MCU1742700.1 hypothetical protein [Pseudomonas sp. 20P_3.2_Bac5]
MSSMKGPKLVPPCPGWKEDLPGPYKLPIVIPDLGLDTPNHQDEVFLELPRAAALARGWLIWFAPVQAILTVVILLLFLSDWRRLSVDEWVAFFFGILVAVWSLLFCVKVETKPPRDLPLRFNRARQRLYAYNFKYRWWNPFEEWRVVPVAYDWSQVRAERWRRTHFTAQGGTIIQFGVELSIVKPGTNEVIDRFPLTAMGADEHAWAYVCTYMQQGPDALPPPEPPWDHNDVLWCNIAMLLAPKVEWPADMDLESKTAP